MATGGLRFQTQVIVQTPHSRIVWSLLERLLHAKPLLQDKLVAMLACDNPELSKLLPVLTSVMRAMHVQRHAMGHQDTSILLPIKPSCD